MAMPYGQCRALRRLLSSEYPELAKQAFGGSPISSLDDMRRSAGG